MWITVFSLALALTPWSLPQASLMCQGPNTLTPWSEAVPWPTSAAVPAGWKILHQGQRTTLIRPGMEAPLARVGWLWQEVRPQLRSKERSWRKSGWTSLWQGLTPPLVRVERLGPKRYLVSLGEYCDPAGMAMGASVIADWTGLRWQLVRALAQPRGQFFQPVQMLDEHELPVVLVWTSLGSGKFELWNPSGQGFLVATAQRSNSRLHARVEKWPPAPGAQGMEGVVFLMRYHSQQHILWPAP